ncbi:UNVERIFIED_CONTAM: hypothetical protein Sindi_1273000 [Sesamum indicum]
MPPLAPPFREETDTLSRPSRVPSVCLHSRHPLDQGKGKASLVADLRRGVLSPRDRQLLSPFAKEELEGMGSLYLFKAASVYEELSYRSQGNPPSSDAKRHKLEDRLELVRELERRLRDTKKEVAGRCQQLERVVRQLKKEATSQESAMKKAMEKVVMDFPYSKERKNFLEAYWENRLKEFKCSVEYQQEVVKIARLFFKYGFSACKDQFQAQGYPYAGEEPSFLDLATAWDNTPNHFVGPSV